MEKSLNGLSVNMCDQITRSKSGLKGWWTTIYFHYQVMDCVEISVTEVNTDGSNGKAEAFGASSDNDWCIESVD